MELKIHHRKSHIINIYFVIVFYVCIIYNAVIYSLDRFLPKCFTTDHLPLKCSINTISKIVILLIGKLRNYYLYIIIFKY